MIFKSLNIFFKGWTSDGAFVQKDETIDGQLESDLVSKKKLSLAVRY